MLICNSFLRRFTIDVAIAITLTTCYYHLPIKVNDFTTSNTCNCNLAQHDINIRACGLKLFISWMLMPRFNCITSSAVVARCCALLFTAPTRFGKTEKVKIYTFIYDENLCALDYATVSKPFRFRPSALSLSCHSWARILLCKKKVYLVS